MKCDAIYWIAVILCIGILAVMQHYQIGYWRDQSQVWAKEVQRQEEYRERDTNLFQECVDGCPCLGKDEHFLRMGPTNEELKEMDDLAKWSRVCKSGSVYRSERFLVECPKD